MQILCDVREFRSKLPTILHQSGVNIVPLTLEVGDYVLTPNIVVERKSIEDLFQSFSTGRLYNQVEAMFKTYSEPTLLIEFDNDDSFCLQPASQIPSEIAPQNIISKLVLLTQHFPLLRILWCRSPHETAQLFLKLKAGQESASPPGSAESLLSLDLPSMSIDPIKILRKLPGITDHNYKDVINNVSNLDKLSTMMRADLVQLLGETNGVKLYEFFKKTHAESDFT